MEYAEWLRFAPLGKAQPNWTLGDAVHAFSQGQRVWFHIVDDQTDGPRAFLQDQLGFHPIHIEDALSPYERPSIFFEEGYVFLVAPAICVGEGESYTDVAFFFNKHFLVTVSHGSTREVESTFNTVRENPARHTGLPTGILHTILDKIVDAYYPAIDRLAEAIDELEDLIFQDKKVDIGEALSLKRRLLEMRRRAAPLRDVLSSLMRVENSIMDKESRIYYQDIYDHANRVIELVDNERDIVSTVMDVHLAVQSNSLNRVMRSMTIISTLLMTGAFVAGVYGMNFHFMPELQSPYGYPFALGLMVALCLLEIWVFKKRKWF